MSNRAPDKLSRSTKDAIELNYWAGVEKDPIEKEKHLHKLSLYLWAFGNYAPPRAALEIGPGPYGGVLPLLNHLQFGVGVDPNIDAYRDRNIGTILKLEHDRPNIRYLNAHFEDWDPNGWTFDAVFSTDALDHGEMGFHLLPKVHSLLNPNGRFFLHVNLRPSELLNDLHDHLLSADDLATEAARCKFRLPKCTFYPEDIDGAFKCPTLVAVLEKR